MSKRQCGPCTACCEGWLTSKTIEMSPGNPCQHCTAKGCAIYESRPVDPCVSFRCGWLIEESPLPDHMRPDLCGAIVMLKRTWGGREVIYASPTGERIPPETLEWLMAHSREQNIPLLFTENLKTDGKFTTTRRTGYGPPSFVDAVKNAIKPDDVMMF